MTDKKSTSQTISKIINLLIGIIVFWTWSCMTFRLGRLGAQSTGGFSNLRYFTVLSNLFQGVVSLAYFFGRKVSRLKYAATTAIAFTFIVVLCFLGPTRGYDSVYSGANFFSHLVVPVLAIADFLIFDREGTFTLRDSFIAMIPMLAYSIFYIGNLCINGIEGNDFYGIARGGILAAVPILLLLPVANWVIALVLRLPRRDQVSRGKSK